MGGLLTAGALGWTLILAAPLIGRQWSDAGLKLAHVEINEGHLYVLAQVAIDPAHSKKQQGADLRLFRCSLGESGKGAAAIGRFDLPVCGHPFHWRLSHGSFWADNPRWGNGVYRIPKDQFPPANVACDTDEYRRKYGNRSQRYRCLRPEEARTALGGNLGFAVEFPFKAWYTFLPTGKDTALFFLRRESDPANPEERGPDIVEVYRGDGGPIKEGPYKGRFWFDWEKVESFPAEFRGDFQVRRKGEDYYLILESGQVYLARKPAKGQQRKLEEIWGKDRPPITAILTDSDHDEVYLFGKAKQKDGKPFFFPLSAKPQAKEFDLDVFARGPVDEPLRSAFGMARAAGLAKDSPREKVPAPRP